MKHNGVIIQRVPYNAGYKEVTRGPRKGSFDPIIEYGWCPKGVGYPMEKDEALKAADELVAEVMRCCKCDRKEAVKLINA